VQKRGALECILIDFFFIFSTGFHSQQDGISLGPTRRMRNTSVAIRRFEWVSPASEWDSRVGDLCGSRHGSSCTPIWF